LSSLIFILLVVVIGSVLIIKDSLNHLVESKKHNNIITTSDNFNYRSFSSKLDKERNKKNREIIIDVKCEDSIVYPSKEVKINNANYYLRRYLNNKS
jgi:hypothetical protein